MNKYNPGTPSKGRVICEGGQHINPKKQRIPMSGKSVRRYVIQMRRLKRQQGI